MKNEYDFTKAIRDSSIAKKLREEGHKVTVYYGPDYVAKKQDELEEVRHFILKDANDTISKASAV